MEQWFVGIFLAFSLVFLASLYLKYGAQLRKRDAKEHGCPVHGCKHEHGNSNENKTPKIAVTSAEDNKTERSQTQNDIHKLAKLLSKSANNATVINEAFEIALQVLKALPKTAKISTESQLKLYGLFKQANEGNIAKTEPSKLYFAEHSKWQSWNSQKGKARMSAKKEYFEFVYSAIIKPLQLNVLLFDTNDTIPKQYLPQTNANTNNNKGFAMNFAVNSKMEQFAFNEALHGSPNELFNKFDLTKGESHSSIDAITEYILEHKIDINKQNENGTTFLNFAVDNDRFELSKVLISQFKANVNLADDMGYTALHCAAMNGNSQIVQLLLQNGADVNAKSNEDDETAFDLADTDHIKQLLTVK